MMSTRPTPKAPPADAERAEGPDEAMDRLREMRESIDNIDAALVHLLAERFKCTQRVGRLKARHGLPPADPRREAEQIARLRALAESAHLDPAFAEKFLTFVIEEVIRHHRALAGDTDPAACPPHTTAGSSAATADRSAV